KSYTKNNKSYKTPKHHFDPQFDAVRLGPVCHSSILNHWRCKDAGFRHAGGGANVAYTMQRQRLHRVFHPARNKCPSKVKYRTLTKHTSRRRSKKTLQQL